MREVVSREIERSRDVSLLEEHGRPGIKDECILAIDGRTEFSSPTVAAGAILNGGAATRVVNSASNRCSGV